MNDSARRIEVYILSGFLGSGKSTLLHHLIHEEKRKGRRIGVLMNELGQVSIDSSFVPLEMPLVELLDGCVCCSIQGELTSKLSQMTKEYDLDSIYIEATGVAHPMEVLDACISPALGPLLEIKAMITVINAQQWLERHNEKRSVQKLLESQVKYADLIVLNKMDMIQSKQSSLYPSIKKLNSKAPVISTSFGQMDFAVFFSLRHTEHTEKNINTEAHVDHHLHLRSFSQSVSGPIDRLSLLEWIKNVPGKIYRAKGFLHLTESPRMFLFQYAYGEPMFVPYRADRSIQPVLVFIGEDLNLVQMKDGLKRLQETSSMEKYK
jgi:G3E family GTPase